MNIVKYLTEIYGYGTPIFLKDIRIGKMSKNAIKMQIFRACKDGDISRDGSGVYSIISKNNELGPVSTFEKIVENKFLYRNNVYPGFEQLFVEGYYSGQTFLNMIGITNQVPAILEITTNKTSAKKRYYAALGRVAIIRKARTKITYQNYRMLQLLDMFYFLTLDEVKGNKEIIRNYIKRQQLQKCTFYEYIKFYNDKTLKKLVEGGIIDAFM